MLAYVFLFLFLFDAINANVVHLSRNCKGSYASYSFVLFYFVCVGVDMKVKVIGKAYAVSGLHEIAVWQILSI